MKKQIKTPRPKASRVKLAAGEPRFVGSKPLSRKQLEREVDALRVQVRNLRFPRGPYQVVAPRPLLEPLPGSFEALKAAELEANATVLAERKARVAAAAKIITSLLEGLL